MLKQKDFIRVGNCYVMFFKQLNHDFVAMLIIYFHSGLLFLVYLEDMLQHIIGQQLQLHFYGINNLIQNPKWLTNKFVCLSIKSQFPVIQAYF